MMRKTEYLCVFLTGGVLCSGIELLWRGYTHWSMTRRRRLLRCALGWNVWDYSAMPGNLLG